MGGSDAPMPYMPANQAGADSAYTSTLGNLTSTDTGNLGLANQGYGQIYDKVMNNPFTADALTGVSAAAKQGSAAGATDIAHAGTLNSFAPSLVQYGFDPQNAMYNWNLRGAQDQQKVANAESGLAGSPFGAGLVGDATAKFNMDWGAQKQQRAQEALTALSQLFSQSSGLAHTGAQSEAAAAALPQQTYYDITGQTLEALNQLVQGMGTASGTLQKDVGLYGNYMQLGQSATQIADQATQINNSSSGILGGLGSLFGLGTGGGGTLGGDLLGAIGKL